MRGKGAPAEFVHRKNVSSETIYANIAVNEKLARTHVDFKRVCVCASGPSLADHVEDIRARQQAGWAVAAMNGSFKFLLSKGIAVDYMFMVDARKGKNLSFLRDLPNGTSRAGTRFIIASQCDPEIFEELKDDHVLLWSMFHDADGYKVIQETRNDKRIASFVGAVNVGQSCLPVLWALGFKTWHMFGYDGSVKLETVSAGGGEWAMVMHKHAFAQAQNDGEEIQEFFWPMRDGEFVEGVSKKYFATPTMAHAATLFPDKVTYYRKVGVDIEVIGEGLLPDMVRGLAGTEGAITAQTTEKVFVEAPPANPRRPGRKTKGLPIVTFKWKGHIPYTAEDVNVWGRMVERNMRQEHELVCITDDADGIDGNVRTIPMWREQFEHGRDWHRLKLFHEEMADLLGARFAVMDLDTLITGEIDELFATDAPFKAWEDPNRDQYCTSLFLMDAGAYPHVWETFNREQAMKLRQSGAFGGYDQAWISHVLPGMPRWTKADGVLSFRVDILGNGQLPEASRALQHPWRAEPPAVAKIINFHGKHNPRDGDVQEAFPWVRKHLLGELA